MRCDEAAERLDPYLDGELDPAARAALDSHLAACRGCREGLEARSRLASALADLPLAPPPTGGPAAVMARLPGDRRALFWLRLRPLLRLGIAAGLGGAIFGAYYLGFEDLMVWIQASPASTVDPTRLAAVREFRERVSQGQQDAFRGRHRAARQCLAEARRMARELGENDTVHRLLGELERTLESWPALESPADLARLDAQAEPLRTALASMGLEPGEPIGEGRRLAIERIGKLVHLELTAARVEDNMGRTDAAIARIGKLLPWAESIELSGWTWLEPVVRDHSWAPLLRFRFGSAWNDLLRRLEELRVPARVAAARASLRRALEERAPVDPLLALVLVDELRVSIRSTGHGRDHEARVPVLREILSRLETIPARPDLADLEGRTGVPGLAREVRRRIVAARLELGEALVGESEVGNPNHASGVLELRRAAEELVGVPPAWEQLSMRGNLSFSIRFDDLAESYRQALWAAANTKQPWLARTVLEAATTRFPEAGRPGVVAAGGVWSTGLQVLRNRPEWDRSELTSRYRSIRDRLRRCADGLDGDPGRWEKLGPTCDEVGRSLDGDARFLTDGRGSRP